MSFLAQAIGEFDDEDDEIDREDTVEEIDLTDETDPSTRAWTKLEAGPASATQIMSRLGRRSRPKLTGTGLA